MSELDEQEITAALDLLRRRAPEAMARLLPAVYADLRRIAHRQLAAESTGHTLSTTALVHEAYLRFANQANAELVNRGQFFALAARTMRRVLVDYARRHHAERRGGAHREVLSLSDPEAIGSLAGVQRAAEFIALDEALERLTEIDPRLASVVECRFFGGLLEAETAEALGVSQRTVARDWLMAKGWLYRELRDEQS